MIQHSKPSLVPAITLLCASLFSARAQSPIRKTLLATPTYTVLREDGAIPRLWIQSHGTQFFRLPIVSGLSTIGEKLGTEEQLTDIHESPLAHDAHGVTTLTVTATSSLWTTRRFLWRFFPDHIEFQQFATGDRPVQRAYFFSNGFSGLYDYGTSQSIASNSIIDAEYDYAPNANFDTTTLLPIELPLSLGVAGDPGAPGTSREQASRLFSPPPLTLSFGTAAHWASIGIGTQPGQYQFNGLEYSGEHFAGASFWVNYQGRATGNSFASPVAAIHFGASPIATLTAFTHWMDASGFSTHNTAPDALWHHLPIFCGWGEQTTIAGLQGKPTIANSFATQANYTQWIDQLEQHGLHPGTIVIDDKWMTKYGTLDVDTAKWPDLKHFVDDQHAHGRHVLLWVPVASTEGLPKDLVITRNGNTVVADVSNPTYEAFLRKQIHHLVVDIGVDGFKEDWIGSQIDFSKVTQSAPLYGIEFVRRFQFILFDEAHRAKPDALIDTQTPNPLFRESSDMLRLNDLYTGTRNVPAVMRNSPRRHRPRRVVELHAVPALDRRPLHLDRLPHRRHPRTRPRRLLEASRHPMAAIHRAAECRLPHWSQIAVPVPRLPSTGWTNATTSSYRCKSRTVLTTTADLHPCVAFLPCKAAGS